LKLLNSHKVKYLLIGGYAVGYHGYPRATADMDIWIGMSRGNALKLVNVLKEFGFDLPEVNEDLFFQENKIIRMGNAPIRIESLTTISGVDFQTCYDKRIEDVITKNLLAILIVIGLSLLLIYSSLQLAFCIKNRRNQ